MLKSYNEANIFHQYFQLLDQITFVDTPGVLSGEKQRTQRSYDFTGVISWFAAKCDLILLLFDPHKLDISDEFKRVIGSLRGQDDKIRVVLNKADQVDTQQVRFKLCSYFLLCSVFHKRIIMYTFFLLSIVLVNESIWSIDVVSRQSAEYSRGGSRLYWVGFLIHK